jgi:hypothetical protein
MGTYDGPLSRGTTGLKFQAICSPAHPMDRKALHPMMEQNVSFAHRRLEPDGSENVIVIDAADELTATVAEYRRYT